MVNVGENSSLNSTVTSKALLKLARQSVLKQTCYTMAKWHSPEHELVTWRNYELKMLHNSMAAQTFSKFTIPKSQQHHRVVSNPVFRLHQITLWIRVLVRTRTLHPRQTEASNTALAMRLLDASWQSFSNVNVHITCASIVNTFSETTTF